MYNYHQKRDKKGRFIKGLRYKPIRLCLYCGKNERRKERKYCSRKCFGLAIRGKSTWIKGKTHSKQVREKLRKSHLGKRPANYGIKRPEISKENHWNWRGGITKLNYQIRECLEYKQWRRKIFKRDNYTCQICGKRGNGELHADHFPKSFANIIKENKIKTLEQALNCKELWDINNGRVLCIKCHRTTDSYSKPLSSNSPNLQEKKLQEASRNVLPIPILSE